jgi:aerotolerance regulator-like protein/VWA domain-containing protein
MGLLAPAFLAGLMAVAIPVLIHMIHRERRETVAFPSLMFLRKIPYRSVRRQKIRHLLLLAMRCLAIAIMVAAFARPFLERRLASAAVGPDGREVVLLVDRSYSMANGGRWDRAVAAARTIASQIRSVDRVSLVTFGATATQVVEPTNATARVERAIATLCPGSEPTRVAAGFRMAAQILGASEMPRKEIVLVSDFHRFGWTASDEVILPERTAVRTVDVSRGESSDVAVASVAVARARTGDRVRATVTARATNLGAEARTVDATLELAGRRVETRRVTVTARATAQVVFAATPVSAASARGVVRITRDSQPSNDAFFFTVAEESGASALIVEPPRPRANQSLFLARAWAVADDPPVRVDVKSADALTAADVRGRSLVVLNESDLPAGTLGAQLRAQTNAGAMLVFVPGEGGVVPSPEWRAVLPAAVGVAVDRGDGGRWASADFSNALFEPFRSARADFSSARVTRYRSLTPADSGRVIGRLDDGAPLLVERAVGNGRVLIWAASVDANWTDLPFHPLWVPLLHQLARRSVAGTEARSWFTAPHVLDLGADRDATVESPSGERIRVPADDARPSVLLRDRGFYEIRPSGTALGAGRPIAINVDLAESDLSHFDPAELVAAVTSKRAGPADARAPLAGTAQEMERRQAIWWYLLFGALLLLAAETLLSNRLSRRSLEQPVTGVS